MQKTKRRFSLVSSLSFLVILLVCTSPVSTEARIVETLKNSVQEDNCNEGFVSVDNLFQNNVILVLSQKFCPSLSTCIPGMCKLELEEGVTKCPTGYLSCDQRSCIQNQCLALVLSREREKQLIREAFEIEQNNIEMDIDVPDLRIKRKVFPFDDDYEDEYDYRRKRQTEDESEGDGDFNFCPAGTLFCLESNQCSPNCGGNGDFLDKLELFDNDDDEEDEDDDGGGGEFIQCPRGTVFCLSEMKCMMNCGMGWDDDDDDFDAMFEDLFKDDDDDEIKGGEVIASCPAGQVFCMQVMACVSNCGFFKEEEGGKDPSHVGGPVMEIEVTCPAGTVFCMTTSKCVPTNQKCDDKDQGEGVHVCPLGLVWCGQGCHVSCAQEDTCPMSDIVTSVGHSTCQIPDHCPDNATCCFDSEGFKQCVMSDSNNTSSNNITTLPMIDSVCSEAPEDLSDIAGADCSLDPGECGPGAVCCDGTCLGLPTINQTMSTDCPPGR